jgi:hypothetical protein
VFLTDNERFILPGNAALTEVIASVAVEPPATNPALFRLSMKSLV